MQDFSEARSYENHMVQSKSQKSHAFSYIYKEMEGVPEGWVKGLDQMLCMQEPGTDCMVS